MDDVSDEKNDPSEGGRAEGDDSAGGRAASASERVDPPAPDSQGGRAASASERVETRVPEAGAQGPEVSTSSLAELGSGSTTSDGGRAASDDAAGGRAASASERVETPAPDGGAQPPEVEPVETRDPKPGSRLSLATGILALVGLGAAILGGLSWYRAAHDDGIDTARTRDAALVAASSEIATLNTLDYRDVDAGLKSWLAATTGTLRDQLASAGADQKKLLADQKKVTTGKVVSAALTDLDADQGTATAIAAVEITVRGTTGEPTIKRNRFTANLTRVDGRWKLETLTQVPVDAS
ncbi:hypothetical protein [Marmoricola endophyticus]|nr:hypothetical protein [Marmoricola endophyticus]